MSGRHGRETDEGIFAHRRDCFQCHVSGALDGPLIVLLKQDGADEPSNRGFVGEDADNLGASFDLAVEAFERVRNRYKIPGADVRLRFS